MMKLWYSKFNFSLFMYDVYHKIRPWYPNVSVQTTYNWLKNLHRWIFSRMFLKREFFFSVEKYLSQFYLYLSSTNSCPPYHNTWNSYLLDISFFFTKKNIALPNNDLATARKKFRNKVKLRPICAPRWLRIGEWTFWLDWWMYEWMSE